MGYTQRTYRQITNPLGLHAYQVQVGESDLAILSTYPEQAEAKRLLLKARRILKAYMARCSEFEGALSPLSPDPAAPSLVQQMLRAGQAANVGPMAAVAGAIAEFVGEALASPEVIIENGGDLYLRTQRSRNIALFAGKSSPFSYKLALAIDPEETPLGISTSSGTVGHSLSFGRADAVTVVSSNCALSDAAATAVANLVQGPKSIENAIEAAQNIPEVTGVVIACGEKLGVWGKIKLVR